MRTRITPNTDTFYAVLVLPNKQYFANTDKSCVENVPETIKFKSFKNTPTEGATRGVQ